MKMIGVILFAVFLLLLINTKNVNATTRDILINDTLDSGENWTLRSGCTINNIPAGSEGILRCIDGDGFRYLNMLFNQTLENSEYSVAFDFRSPELEINNLFFYDTNLSSGTNPSGSYTYLDFAGGVVTLRTSPAQTGSVIYNTVNEWKRLEFQWLNNGTINIYVNGTLNQTMAQIGKNISFFGDHFGQSHETFLDNFVVKNLSFDTSPLNISPVVVINTPRNNSQTHNQTIFINFTITNSDNDNATYRMFIDTNTNPITKINESNITQGNFTFITSLTAQVSGSINGTYYLKINGTDNSSNIFTYFHVFNLTNDLNQYNVTNVSITPLSLIAGTQAKCHFNITNKANILTSLPNQTDNISISDLRWYINKTLLATANNQTLLNAPNVTTDANVSCEARINNGFGDTAWTQYVNSSQAVVGDTTAPILNNCTLSSTSITDASGNTINLTCDATDLSSNIQTMVAYLNGTTNKTLIFSFTQATTIKASYIIFESLETLKVGSYSISQVNVTDTSGNKVANFTNSTHLIVTSAPSGGGVTPSGGGGGGGSIVPPPPQCKENELLVSNKCVNASLFNVTFKVVGLTNIQPIVFYRTCGGFQEFRQMIRTNKVLKNAEFDKPQANTNITIIGSDALITKKLRTSKIAERIDIGNLKLTDITQQVTRVFFGIRIINICNPLTYLFVAVPTIVIIFRKKIAQFLKKK